MLNMDKEKNFVSAVVYISRQSSDVENFLSMIIDVLESNFLSSEIICVNDGADAGTIEAIRTLSRKVGDVSISMLNMSSYHGIESAMKAGEDLAIGDFVFEFDSTIADFSPDIIMAVYRSSLEGADIVTAVPDVSSSRSSRLFYSLFNRFSNYEYDMRTERFHILSRRAINRINSMNKTVPYRKAVYMNCGFPVKNVVYAPLYKNQMTAKDGQEHNYRENLAFDALLLFTDIGYKIAIAFTKIMMMIAILVGCYGAATYITSSPVPGWTTTICFMSFAFFALFGILTIIIKYLQIILNLIFRRKQVSFAGIEKMTK